MRQAKINNISKSANYKGFLDKHHLTEAYISLAQEWFNPVLKALSTHQGGAKKTVFLGLNGSQGSGKSTLSDYLITALEQEYQLSGVSLSLDDFYLSQAKRVHLAEEVHPLLATRGVPGTHDLPLLQTTLAALSAGDPEVTIPRFNKATDNPFPEDQWQRLDDPVDVVILEGWCWGVDEQPMGALYAPVNQMEAGEDDEGIWRCYVNDQLEHHYKPLYQMMDKWLMLCAPGFDTVFRWRLEQEQHLERTLGPEDDRDGVMTEAQVRRFVQYFQRLTLHGLKTMPDKCDFFYELDDDRQIISSLVRPGAVG